MMSKRLFFKAMKEDLRHKIWMMALSVLGSFLAMPVAWLLMRNNMASEMATVKEEVYFVGRTYSFFTEYYMLCGGFIAVSGAFIVGLFGFRYLFFQRMVDTYHSLPVKRGTLFGVCYMDGFLIWFVPASAGLLSAVVMAGRFAYQMGGGLALRGMLKEAAISFVVLVTVFFLVYNMVLVAVMLSGNLLNALVSMMILSFGVLAVYALGIMFFEIYMQTFYADEIFGGAIDYFSPFFSALCLLFLRCDLPEGSWGLWEAILINSGLAAVLGVCAWFLYKRRMSELAEQGICSRVMSAVMRAVAGVTVGMCGWQIFVMYVLDAGAVGWGIFGMALGMILAFGILDVIFRMEFKAFFAHKIQMGGTFALTLLICFAFYWDWFGYDGYLPGKDEIAEIAVYDMQFNNRSYGTMHIEPLENMAFCDTEAIYAYLEAMTAARPKQGTYDRVRTKVTLKDGRSYYRNYWVFGADKEAVWPLLASGEYMKCAYCIDEEWAGECDVFTLTRNGKSVRIGDFKTETVSSILRAYNEDVLADPDAALLGEGRLLVRMEVILGKDFDQRVFTLDIYETMERVLETLRQAGYQEWVAVAEASNIRSVELPLRLYGAEPILKETVIASARDVYGVYEEENPGRMQESLEEQEAFDEEEVWAESREAVMEEWTAEDYRDYTVYVTEKAEVEELLALASYVIPFRGGNVFREEYVDINIEDIDGNTKIYYIRKGLLPEKYILRFGEGTAENP